MVDVSAHLPRLKRIIYKAAIDSKAASTLIPKSAVLPVINGLAEKPCDLIRLLRVHAGNSITDDGIRTGEPVEVLHLRKKGYDHNSQYIKHSNIRNGNIRIDYYAIPFIETEDENGNTCQELLISHEQMDYCAYLAISIILRDEWARQKISGQVYQEFSEHASWAYNAALGSARNFSIDQLESAAWMLRNGQFFNTK